MQIVCVVITLLASVVLSSANNGTYVVVSSKIARFGVPYTVSVILAEDRKSAQTGTLTLTNQRDTSQTKSQSFTIDSTENKKDIEMTILPTENLDAGQYILRFQMTLNSRQINKSTSIELNGDAGICMIMTDRGIYKRSQKVQFRVVCLNDELKPISKEMDITIVDPDGNKVEMYKKQSNVKGVITHSYELSDSPTEGVWKIQVQQTDGQGTMSERNITVESYVLPRFAPEISTSQPYVNVKDFQSVQVTVTGMYTYGEPVHGKALISFTMTGTPTIKKEGVLRDGKATFTLTQKEVGDPTTITQILCGGWCRYAKKQSYPMTIKAKVVEFTTSEEQETASVLNFYTEPVAIKLVNVKEYRKDMTYTAYFHITDPSGQPLPKSERTKYNIKVLWKADYNNPGFSPAAEELPTDTDDVIMKFTWSPRKAQYSLFVQGEVYDKAANKTVVTTSESVSSYQSFTGAGVQIELLNSASSLDEVRSATKVYDIGDTIYVKTTGKGPKGFKTDMFLYLMAKGKQVKSYEVSSGTVTTIVIDQSMGLAPSASLLLWSLSSEGELVADEMEIFVSGLLKNTMSMQFNQKRQYVGRDVTLTVDSKVNSDIYVVAIDKGSQLLKEPNDITFEQTNDAIMKFDTREEKKDTTNWIRPFMREKRSVLPPQNYYSGTATKNIMQTVGYVYLTDAFVAEVQNDGVILEELDFAQRNDVPESKSNVGQTVQTDQSGSSGNQIRKFFPESWIWFDGNVGPGGTFTKDFTLPDTITSWTTRGFSISPEFGLGIASNIKVEGFKDFFVVVSLPASALRGEKVEVKLVVFNYYDTDKQVRIRLKQSNDFMIYDHKPTNVSNPISGDFEKIFEVKAKQSKGERCYIEASGLGIKILRVEAAAGMMSGGSFNVEETDIVIKPIPIDPEGKKIYGGYQKLLDATSLPLKLKPVFPSNFVKDSRGMTLGVTGDIMGKALANIDKLLRVPYGCGEQNMISLVPNIYALLYMEATSISNTEVKDKAMRNMKLGYQRELTYRHNDTGGFSAFGKSDKHHSTWLTAFVMKAFAQASKFIFIDDKVLLRAKEALMMTKKSDGSFYESGIVHHRDLNAGTSGGEMLTAYVYVAIMETKKAGNVLDSFDASKTLKYLEDFYDRSKSSTIRLTNYQLAVLSYCFSLGKSQKLDLILADLDGSSTKTDDGEMTCWCDFKVEEIDNRKSYWCDPKPSAIETAAYVLLAYIEKDDKASGIKLVKWLMTQTNSRGGFASTQDTVMGLQALSQYAELVSKVEKNLDVTFRTPGLTDVVFNINKDNFLLLQQEDIKNNFDIMTQNGVEIIVQGTGSVVASLNWEYNIDVDDTYEELKVTVETYEIDEFTTEIKTCVWYTGTEDTGMVVVNVGLITGYTLTNLDDLKKAGRVKRVDPDGNKLDIYFDEMTASQTCFSVRTVQEYIVIEHKPQPVITYLYYKPEKQTTVYYDYKSVIKPTGDAVGLISCNTIVMFMTMVTTMYTMIQF